MDNDRKKDRRVLRTLRNLDEALMSLLEEKSMSMIGVTELCERADINRNTFYSHYSNPEEILKHLEKQLIDQIGDALSASSTSENATETVLTALYENKQLARILLSENAASDSIYEIFEAARTRASAKAKQHGDWMSPSYQILMSEFSLAGGIAVVKRWAMDDMPQPPKDIAKFIRIMGNQGSAGLQSSKDPVFMAQPGKNGGVVR